VQAQSSYTATHKHGVSASPITKKGVSASPFNIYNDTKLGESVKWKVESGKWKVESVKWRVENVKWRVESDEWWC
jgi:hypothetical protein